MELRHEFVWSVSRRAAFGSCLRRYYFAHYLAWLGWKHDAPDERRRAHRLKHLTSLEAHAGDCVRRAVAHWFEMRAHGISGGPRDVEQHALSLFRDGFRESRERTPGGLRLAEHHYAEPADEERLAESAARRIDGVKTSVRTFFEAPLLEEAREASPDTCLEREERGFSLAGTTVLSAPDFAHAERVRGPRRVSLYDWTGGDAEDLRLGLHALHAREVHGLDPQQVRVVAIDLERGRGRVETFDSFALEAVEDAVTRSAAEMRLLHFDAGAGCGDPERFPELPPDAPACRTCAFREACGRAAPSDAGRIA